jgi:hypothetical protein
MACDDRFDWQTLLVSLAFLIASPPSVTVGAERSVQVTVLNFQLICDPIQCRTPVLEVHENTGVDANYIEYLIPTAARNYARRVAHNRG